MATLRIVGQTKVGTIKKRFKDACGVDIIIYDQEGNHAPDDVTLGSIRKKSPDSLEIQIAAQTKVGNVEAFFEKNYGVSIDIIAANGALADNGVTLGNVRRSYEQKQFGIQGGDATPVSSETEFLNESLRDLLNELEESVDEKGIVLNFVDFEIFGVDLEFEEYEKGEYKISIVLNVTDEIDELDEDLSEQISDAVQDFLDGKMDLGERLLAIGLDREALSWWPVVTENVNN